MPSYDAINYDPPAPIAIVIITSQSGVMVGGIHLLIDTGADTTLLPKSAVERLGIAPDAAFEYELIGFDGSHSKTQAVDLDMIFLNKAFRGRYLLTDSERGILGRDVLASLALILDGPSQVWSRFGDVK